MSRCTCIAVTNFVVCDSVQQILTLLGIRTSEEWKKVPNLSANSYKDMMQSTEVHVTNQFRGTDCALPGCLTKSVFSIGAEARVGQVVQCTTAGVPPLAYLLESGCVVHRVIPLSDPTV